MINQLFDSSTADQMLVDDALEIGFVDVVIPDAIGLHAHNRAGFAGGKAVGAGTLDPEFAFIDADGFKLLAQGFE